MRSITGRLDKLERAAHEIKTASPDTPCICKFGEQSFYFVVEGVTEAKLAERVPNNKKHCPRCGGLNHAIQLDENELDL